MFFYFHNVLKMPTFRTMTSVFFRGHVPPGLHGLHMLSLSITPPSRVSRGLSVCIYVIRVDVVLLTREHIV